MDTKLISSDTVALLSRITGQKLSKRDLTPPVIFLAALVTVLLGVMFADGTVTDEEKQRWQKTINKLIPSEDGIRQLTQLMSKGVRQNQVYKRLNDLITLTAPLSESEKFLLISFGYEMSAADGKMDASERNYLEAIANQLGIKPQIMSVLEAKFRDKKTLNLDALNKVQSLLDPTHFYSLDTVFVKAASDMLAVLTAKSVPQVTQQHRTTYEQLQQFQINRQELNRLGNQISQIIQDSIQRNLLPDTLSKQTEQLYQKLQSQRFRLAVVGEFSQGKSTLLNALLGEEIQPVRTLPCSGTVTVLKYGIQKRVTCLYKDGREENIPFEKYQEKAAISQEAAIDSLSDELVQSEIAEIILEHPDLDLCRHGVEILDSPGLNEHPERTAITQQLLKGTDAVVFLVNASRPLTQGERELIQDLKKQLNARRVDKPAENLFLVVNFMDLLRREKDRQDVKMRVESFMYNQNIITGKDRIHFISAQAALDAILENKEDEYLRSFRYFTHCLEHFLTIECGTLGIKRAVTKTSGIIQSTLQALSQAEEVLDGKLKISNTEKHQILEQIGEVSGRAVKIQRLAKQLREQAIKEAIDSWQEWQLSLSKRMQDKSQKWNSKHLAIWNRNKLILDYNEQFNRDIKIEIENWQNENLEAVSKEK